MLCIWEVTSAANAKMYYSGSVAASPVDSRQDYYSEGQEVAGKYGGKLAERFGLDGQFVDKTTFHHLCDNQHPILGKTLTPRNNEQRRVAYDFTFSGPKSFSILEAFATPELRRDLLRAFDDAVTETMVEQIEPGMKTRNRRDGADEDRATGNMIWASFDHATSRPEVDPSAPPTKENQTRVDTPAAKKADPHRHKHVVVFNATYDSEEDRIKAGQFGDLKRDGEYYTSVFYSKLGKKLEDMGFAIDRRGGKKWEVAGVLQSTIDTFSKRTKRIEETARKKGITDPAKKGEIGAKTRNKKDKELSLPELRKSWDEQLTDQERDALAAVYRREYAQGKPVSAKDAVAFALHHLSEKQSAFPEREVKSLALFYGLGSLTVDDINEELPNHGVLVADIDGRRMATTEKLQREEQFITGYASDGRGCVPAVGVPRGLTPEADDGKQLNQGQWDAVLGLLESTNKVNMFLGPAGAGKSYTLQKFDEGMRMAGEKVTYLATTSDAADELAKSGFGVKTLAHFLLDERMQAASRGGTVVLDEAGMCGHADAFALFKLAEKLDMRILLTGDPAQHGSVGRGAFLRILEEYGGIRPFRLTEIMRQENADHRAAAHLLSRGETLAGFDLLDRHLGWVKELAEEDRYKQIAADYLEAIDDKKTVVIISPTHIEAGRITDEIRDQLRTAGKLGKEEREFTRLVPVDASEALRGLATTYQAGDVIQFHQNAVGFTKGDRLTITDPAMVPLAHADKFSLYRPEQVALAKGDKIRFTGSVKSCDGKEHKLRNGNQHMVAGWKKDAIVLDNGWLIPADAGHWRRGFVETSFGAQGRNVQRVIVGMSSMSQGAMNQEMLYVSSTRSKERLTIYCDDKNAVRDGVLRTSQKLAALDVVAGKPLNAKRREREQRQWARRRHVSLQRVRAAAERATPRPQRQEEREISYGR